MGVSAEKKTTIATVQNALHDFRERAGASGLAITAFSIASVAADSTAAFLFHMPAETVIGAGLVQQAVIGSSLVYTLGAQIKREPKSADEIKGRVASATERLLRRATETHSYRTTAMNENSSRKFGMLRWADKEETRLLREYERFLASEARRLRRMAPGIDIRAIFSDILGRISVPDRYDPSAPNASLDKELEIPRIVGTAVTRSEKALGVF